jgi:aminoglycoside/choline kinase family phosphotransferase
MTKNSITIAPERLEQIHALLMRSDFSDGDLHPLAGDASFRRYIRVHKNGSSAMLMDAPPAKEDVRPFVLAAQYLHQQGYSAPAIIAHDIPSGLLLLEDLGDDSFTRILKQADEGKRPALEHELYGAAIDVLAQWHDEKRSFSNPSRFAVPRYDKPLLMREIGLFSDWFMPQITGKDTAQQLAGEYRRLWDELLDTAPLAMDRWVHRDYHADNLMWLPARAGIQRVGLLDFQDGVYGDAAYDLVSLLEDARRDVPPALVADMLERYIEVSGTSAERLRAAYAVLGAQRNSKIIGIFSRLAARDGKQHYLDYLPRVWRHLENDLQHPSLAGLKQWLDRYVAPEHRGVIAIRHTAQDLALTA